MLKFLKFKVKELLTEIGFKEFRSFSGTFSYFILDRESSTSLYKWAQEQNIKNIIHPDKMHCTVIYSKTKVINYFPYQIPIVLSPRTYKLNILNGALVLIFNHPIPRQQFMISKMHGATSDYPSFIPHITISYDPGSINIAKIVVPRIPITLTREYVESISNVNV
jgi:hypothetical protein